MKFLIPRRNGPVSTVERGPGSGWTASKTMRVRCVIRRCFMAESSQTPILKRRYRNMQARPVAFVDLKSRLIAFEEGPIRPFYRDVGRVLPLDGVLRVVAGSHGVEVVYVVGGWNAESSPVTEWFAAPLGWERLTYHRNPFIAVYKQTDGGGKL